jgi:hypothetical protein
MAQKEADRDLRVLEWFTTFEVHRSRRSTNETNALLKNVARFERPGYNDVMADTCTR